MSMLVGVWGSFGTEYVVGGGGGCAAVIVIVFDLQALWRY